MAIGRDGQVFFTADGTGYRDGLEEKLKKRRKAKKEEKRESWRKNRGARWPEKEGEAKGGCFVHSQTTLGLGTSLFLNILSHSLLIHEHGFGYLPWTSRATGWF